jgi:hypothetical protein
MIDQKHNTKVISKFKKFGFKGTTSLVSALITLGLSSQKAFSDEFLVDLESVSDVMETTVNADGSLTITMEDGQQIDLESNQFQVAPDGTISLSQSVLSSLGLEVGLGASFAVTAGSIAAAALGLAAIGSSGSTAGGDDVPEDGSDAGIISDGYWANAKVFYDANANNALDDGEETVFSDGSGRFSDLTYTPTSEGRIVALATQDTTDATTSADIADGAFMSAPSGSTAVTFGTTLMVETGLTSSQLAVVLGMPEDTDLTTFDHLAAENSSTEELRQATVNLAAKSQQILNIITQAKSSLTAAGADEATAIRVAAKSVAETIKNNVELDAAAEIDFSESTFVGDVLDIVLTDEELTVGLSDIDAKTLETSFAITKDEIAKAIKTVNDDIQEGLELAEVAGSTVTAEGLINDEVVLNAIKSIATSASSLDATVTSLQIKVKELAEAEGNEALSLDELVAVAQDDASIAEEIATIEDNIIAVLANAAPEISTTINADEIDGEYVLYQGLSTNVVIATIAATDSDTIFELDAAGVEPNVTLVGADKEYFKINDRGEIQLVGDLDLSVEAIGTELNFSAVVTDEEGKSTVETFYFNLKSTDEVPDDKILVSGELNVRDGDSLSEAVAATVAGNSLFLGAGEFTSNVTLNGISIFGAQSNSDHLMVPTEGEPDPNLENNARGEETIITGTITVSSDDVTLSGVTLENPAGPPIAFVGESISGFELSNSFVRNYPAGALTNTGVEASDWTFDNNFIGGVSTTNGNGGALYLSDFSQGTLSGNVFWRPGAAHLYGDDWQDVSVDGNYFFHGLHAGGADFDGFASAVANKLGYGGEGYGGEGYGSEGYGSEGYGSEGYGGEGYGSEGYGGGAGQGDFYGRNYWFEITGDNSNITISNNTGKYNSGGIQFNGEDVSSSFSNISIEGNTFSDFINADPDGTYLTSNDNSRHDSGFMGAVQFVTGEDDASIDSIVIKNNSIVLDRDQIDATDGDDITSAFNIDAATRDIAIVGNTVEIIGDTDLVGSVAMDSPITALALNVSNVSGDIFIGSNTFEIDVPILLLAGENAVEFGEGGFLIGSDNVLTSSLALGNSTVDVAISGTSIIVDGGIDPDITNSVKEILDGSLNLVAIEDDNSVLETITGTSSLDSSEISAAFEGPTTSYGVEYVDGISTSFTLPTDAVLFTSNNELEDKIGDGLEILGSKATMILDGLIVETVTDDDEDNSLNDELAALLLTTNEIG